jgi:hypothetical protein
MATIHRLTSNRSPPWSCPILSLNTLPSSYAIHQSAWKRHSRNFACMGFSEAGLKGCTRSEEAAIVPSVT